MSVEPERYEYVDALRGYAILGVIAVHTAGAIAPASLALQRMATEGARGVQLFFVASALTLCLSWQARVSHERSPVRNFDHVVVSVACACFALALSAWRRSVLVNQLVIRIGKLSYNMYLVHFAVIEALQRFLLPAHAPASDVGFAGVYALVVVLAAALSKATYALIERRGIALGKHVVDKLEARTTPLEPAWVRS